MASIARQGWYYTDYQLSETGDVDGPRMADSIKEGGVARALVCDTPVLAFWSWLNVKRLALLLVGEHRPVPDDR